MDERETRPGSSIKRCYRNGLKVLGGWRILLVIGVAVGFYFALLHEARPPTETVFLASVAVLVFLLPAATYVGQRVTAEVIQSMKVAESGELETVSANVIGDSLRAAELLQVGFSCTFAATITSTLSLISGGWQVGNFRVNYFLTSLSLAFLVTAAFAIFPMTWLMLQLEAVREAYDAVTNKQGPNGSPAERQ